MLLLTGLKQKKGKKSHFQDFINHSPLWQDYTEKRLIDSEIIQLVYAEIENLPSQVKEVVRLSLIEGKTIGEIANQMNIAYKTVQNHKTKGFNTIKMNLLEEPVVERSFVNGCSVSDKK